MNSPQLATHVMNYGGNAVRGGQLFGEQTTIAMTKKYFKGLQGVENVYTQHKPYMIDVLQVRVFAPTVTTLDKHVCSAQVEQTVFVDI